MTEHPAPAAPSADTPAFFAPTAPALAAAGAAMADTRGFGSVEEAPTEGPAIEMTFVDVAGYPIDGAPYRLTLPDGTTVEDVLAKDGAIRRSLDAPGRVEVVLPRLGQAAWAASETRVGQPVGMQAATAGFPDGTPAAFLVYRRQIREADALVDTVASEVQGGRLEADWSLDTVLGATTTPPDDGEPPPTTVHFYFEVQVGPCLVRSAPLLVKDDLAIELLDDKGQPRASVEYVVLLPDWTARRGRTDLAGRATERDVPPGFCAVTVIDR